MAAKKAKKKSPSRNQARTRNVMARAAAATAPSITDLQHRNFVLALLSQKRDQLAAIQRVLIDMVANHTVPAEEVLGTIQQLRAEINKCNQAIATIATGNIVNFPTDAQIAALQIAVARVASITLRTAAAREVLAALSALVATFPD
jgi:hypothetical protein